MEITPPIEKKRKKRILSRTKSAIAARKAAKKKPVPKKKAVKKRYEYKGKFIPYERAKKVVKVLELKSRDEYISWHEKYKPDYLPKRPDNAYKKEFEDWTIFLSKPAKGVVTKRMLEEKYIAAERKRKEKEKIQETKRLKTELTALVRHEMKLAQNKVNRLKRREEQALTKHRKEKKKNIKRLEKPVIENFPGRIKKDKISKYISYAEAKKAIEPEKFANIKEYNAWWDINQPSGIPKRPDRVYPNFKWSDYLNKEVEYFKKKNYREMYRTYEQAVSFVRTLGIENAKQWQDYYKTGKCPKDIPRYPNLVYRYRPDDIEWGKWFTWDEWLGKNANYVLDAFKEKQKVMLVTVPNGAPAGIYSFIYKMGTQQEIDAFIDDNELYVIRIYKIEVYDWMGYLTRRFSPYQGQSNVYVISNINAVLYDLDNYMERIL